MKEAQPPGERVLVIKLGALGDFVQAMGPAAAIRKHHSAAQITLLTTPPFAALGEAAPYFDRVWIDRRPSPARAPLAVWRLRKLLRSGRFDRVYDLQTSDRSSFYFQLMGPGRRPEWSGIARGCSHPHDNPSRDFMHTLERQQDQLAAAGLIDVPPPDLSWLDADVGVFELGPEPLALLVPGGAAHRPDKRWPAERYAELAEILAGEGCHPVLIGGTAERGLTASITARFPGCGDLAGMTSFAQIAALARRSRLAIGNDTGPMHLIAAVGCPSLVLFSEASDPAITRPRGPDVHVIRRQRLADLSAAEVAAALPGG